MYRDTVAARSFEEAEKKALKILKTINKDNGLQRLNYITDRIDDRRRAITGFSGKEKKGESAIICSQKEASGYSVLFFSAKETDPSNFIQPFQNASYRLATFAVEGLGSHIFRPPQKELPVEDDPMRESNIRAVSEFIAPGPYGSDGNIYWDLSGSTGGTFEEMIGGKLPAPAVLEGAAGMGISSADDYVEAWMRAAGISLNDEEKSSLKERYTSTILSFFLNFAAYEFFRTEKYSRLSEILSKAPAFGLHGDLDSLIASRGYPGITAPVYILIQYLQTEATSSIGAPALSLIADSTKTPKEVIYRAARHPEIIPF